MTERKLSKETHKAVLKAWDEFRKKLRDRLYRWKDWDYDVFQEDAGDELLLKIIVKKR